MAAGPSFLAPLSYPVFRSIWIASLASNLGGLIQSVGAAWLMTSITTSADMVALVTASTTLPMMLFSLASGAVADTFDRRKVMLLAQAIMLIVSVLLALFTFFDLITPWSLLVFTFLIGCGTTMNNPSWQASVGDMVPRDVLPGAVTLNSVNFNLTRSVGPAIGGIIVASVGAATAFIVNAFSYIPLLFVIFRWKPPKQAAGLPPEALGMAMTSGLRYVAMSPHIEAVILRASAFGFATVVVLALLPLVARSLPGGGALLYGLLFGCYGVGAVSGAFIGGKARERWSNEIIARGAFVGFAACAAAIAISSSPWVVAAAIAGGGACWVIALSMFNVTVQLATPRWVVGRALALYQAATFGGMALGSWIWGVLAENYGLSAAFAVAALAILAGGAIGFQIPLPNPSTDNLAPLNRFKAPSLALELQGRSGPLAVMIEYTIREDDVPAFMLAMRERRRIRRRDGARQWELLRDAEHPDIWMESYHVPTWHDYLRHNQRRTHADAAIDDRIRALHSGVEPPKVHRMIVRPTDALDPGTPLKTPIDLE